LRTLIKQFAARAAAAGRRIGRFVLLLGFCLAGAQLQGAYRNPNLKILLFKSAAGVYLTSLQEMTLRSPAAPIGIGKRILLTPDGPRGLRVNNRLPAGNTLLIKTSGKTQVMNLDDETQRTYLGDFEIRLLTSGLHIINSIPTELYLEGVLNAEISTRWHIEVVKAQVVVSRTFALFKRQQNIDAHWHLSADHHDQVYKGVEIADQRGLSAIRATTGIVVGYRGELAQTFYHSNCGGITADPQNTWKYRLPYLKIKPVPFGKTDPRYHWQRFITDSEMLAILGRAGLPDTPVDRIAISKRTPSNRVLELTVFSHKPHVISGNAFRKASGFQTIQSLLFDMIKVPGGYRFEGTGNGHGVGLSQWSAKEMAERGYKYHDIIFYFYDGTELMIHNG